MRAEDYRVSDEVAAAEMERREERRAEEAEQLRALKREVSRLPGDSLESMIAQALRSHAEKMDEGAESARIGAEAPPEPTTQETKAMGVTDTVSLRPTPGGFAHMRDVFLEESRRARLLCDYVEAFGLRKLAKLCPQEE